MVRAVVAASSAPVDAVSAARRRTRASKPKVRTGCITWIRRVKCGEEKPACFRCTSTGRKCDGYDKGAPSRHRNQDTVRGLELARAEFLRAYRVNDALRCMRPIVADIDGTEAERRFFHGFRAVSSGGLSSHVCDTNDFFNRVCPQMSHRDDAVKHAVVALGSAYQLFQAAEGGPAPPPGSTREELEVFTIEQYTKSLSKLQRHVGSASRESTRLFLVCCLAFICLESLRGNQDSALTHLKNGLNILRTLGADSFGFLARDHSDSPTAMGGGGGEGASGMEDIIRMFGRLEMSASFFASDVVPIVSVRSYQHRRRGLLPCDDGNDDGSGLREFSSLRELHEAQCAFSRDVHGRMAETQRHWGDLAFWARPEEQRRQRRMAERERRLDGLCRRFAASEGAPRPGTPEHFSLHVDALHLRLAGVFLRGMTGLDPETFRATCPQPTKGDQAVLREMLATATMLYQGGGGGRKQAAQQQHLKRKTRGFTYDAGVVGPVYFVAISAEDAALRARALRLLQDINMREGFWDGPALQRLVRVVGKAIEANRWPFEEVPRTVVGLGSVPGIYETLARLELSDSD
ncbi:C6 zinc finger domain-containing protein [Pleurostoma richardsiae]|uniref:C6 zinc finger domain-containing protein n=1 Tax=Pleurostoma richardsiae TaxID=41990 RepID=A0AA38VV57_9PEZI|nr:C6 zinc finger domain-containing protein [Pleurostoma richardsiae]